MTQLGLIDDPAQVELNFTATESMQDVLFHRVKSTPDDIAFRFLSDGEDQTVEWTYSDLQRCANLVARKLTENEARPARVLLVLEPGLEYIAALFGIFQAGSTAVPSFPPIGNRAISRLLSIHADCDADFIIAGGNLRSSAERLTSLLAAHCKHPQWIFLDDTFFSDKHVYTYNFQTYNNANSRKFQVIAKETDETFSALLQYTSGSTGHPKGVMLSHANLISNCKVLASRLGEPERHIGFSWLPPYHDMGLMGALLLSVYGGFPLTMMSPAHFIQRPMRYLRAMSKHQVTTSVVPNFALDLCVDTVTDEALSELDLSRLTMVFCGAEPIRASTLDRFATRFKACGFSPSAYVPCYGLAEATLFISGKPRSQGPPEILRVNKADLANGLVSLEKVSGDAKESGERVPAQEEISQIVSCGTIAEGHEIAIVDPANCTLVDDGIVGEIWFSGASVALGYLNKKSDSDLIFNATLDNSIQGKKYLRTGDLGFRLKGELYITGRIKDVIIFAGRNLYPQDIETSVEMTHPAIRTNGVAAFSVNAEESEKLVLVAEISRAYRLTDADLVSISEAITATIVNGHGVCPSCIHLAPVGTIPLTTSGKVRRSACRDAFLQGALSSYKPREKKPAPALSSCPE